MKTHILILLALLGAAASCSTEKIGGYDSDNFIQFEKSRKDSTLFTFAYDETLTSGEVSLKVNMISPLVGHDRTFRVAYVPDLSTAQPGEEFEMPAEVQTLPANDSIAYIKIDVKRSAGLKGSHRMAVFCIEGSEDFMPGMVEHRFARVIISDQLAQPRWWNAWHEANGLGTYSELKFRTFIRVTGLTDLTLTSDGGTMDYSTMRVQVLRFKYWLAENPTDEEDGSKMTVAMRG